MLLSIFIGISMTDGLGTSLMKIGMWILYWDYLVVLSLPCIAISPDKMNFALSYCVSPQHRQKHTIIMYLFSLLFVLFEANCDISYKQIGRAISVTTNTAQVTTKRINQANSALTNRAERSSLGGDHSRTSHRKINLYYRYLLFVKK